MPRKPKDDKCPNAPSTSDFIYATAVREGSKTKFPNKPITEIATEISDNGANNNNASIKAGMTDMDVIQQFSNSKRARSAIDHDDDVKYKSNDIPKIFAFICIYI